MYNGPMPNTATADVTDFMLLEVVEGKLKLYINFGSGVRTLKLGQQVIYNITMLNILFSMSSNPLTISVFVKSSYMLKIYRQFVG